MQEAGSVRVFEEIDTCHSSEIERQSLQALLLEYLVQDLQEQSLKKKVLRGNWGIAKDKASIHASMEKVQSYEEAFAKIQTATGITDIDELVTTFINAEDQNFALFNYVNEQTNEIEKLEEQVQALQDEQAKYTQESGDDVNQHKLILLDLESKLATTEANASKYESKCEEYQAVIDSLKKAIASAFTKTQCERASSEIFADSSVTEANMLSYLAIIEEQCNTIIKDYVAVKARQHKQTSAEAADVAGARAPRRPVAERPAQQLRVPRAGHFAARVVQGLEQELRLGTRVQQPRPVRVRHRPHQMVDADGRLRREARRADALVELARGRVEDLAQRGEGLVADGAGEVGEGDDPHRVAGDARQARVAEVARRLHLRQALALLGEQGGNLGVLGLGVGERLPLRRHHLGDAVVHLHRAHPALSLIHI